MRVMLGAKQRGDSEVAGSDRPELKGSGDGFDGYGAWHRIISFHRRRGCEQWLVVDVVCWYIRASSRRSRRTGVPIRKMFTVVVQSLVRETCDLSGGKHSPASQLLAGERG